MRTNHTRKPNILFLGIDSLWSDHMSLYGYHRLTTPHMDKLASEGATFGHHFSPSIPTTPGYASMLTGMDCFGTDVVALRHKGPLGSHVSTLAEVLNNNGYNSTCIGFTGNPSARGFHQYLDYEGWAADETGRSPKAEKMNDVAIPELKRLAAEDKPFFLFLRHMDPHSPYLPPKPFERIFYEGNELDPNNKSLAKLYEFEPFVNYFVTWFPEGCTDKEYVNAQYDGAIAYMDACIQNLFTTIEELGIEQETIIVLTSDHGETLDQHDCYYDHHGLYECTLKVPLVIKYPGAIQAGARMEGNSFISDIMPTLLDLAKIDTGIQFDGRSLLPMLKGDEVPSKDEFYITECTWMRKHGWRTPEWKLIKALEPDFHFKPEYELYHLIEDPLEERNLAVDKPELVAQLEEKMNAFIASREQQTGRTNPIYTNLSWHGFDRGPFETSQQAYDTMRIGNPQAAKELQEKLRKN